MITDGSGCGGAKDTAPTFAAIKAILDHLVLGKEADLKLIHGAHFGWTSLDELKAAFVEKNGHQYRLIDPALAGNGRARETYLVRILTAGITLDGRDYPQMPFRGNINGEHATADELARIAAWIDAGCPA